MVQRKRGQLQTEPRNNLDSNIIPPSEVQHQLRTELNAAYKSARDSGYAFAEALRVGVHARIRACGGNVGLDTVFFVKGGLYEPNPYGDPVLILANSLVAGQPEDLVAIKANGEFATRLGKGRWLGEADLYRRCSEAPDHFDWPFWMDYAPTIEPLELIRDPLTWLRNDCEGCVPLYSANKAANQ